EPQARGGSAHRASKFRSHAAFHPRTGGIMRVRKTLRLALVLPWIASAAALLVLLLLAHSQFRLAVVLGDSMWPGLRTGDLLLARKTAYCNHDPGRGDIVLAFRDGELIVKRVVGLPGEEIRLDGGRLYVNGSPLRENYPVQPGA